MSESEIDVDGSKKISDLPHLPGGFEKAVEESASLPLALAGRNARVTADEIAEYVGDMINASKPKPGDNVLISYDNTISVEAFLDADVVEDVEIASDADSVSFIYYFRNLKTGLESQSAVSPPIVSSLTAGFMNSVMFDAFEQYGIDIDEIKSMLTGLPRKVVTASLGANPAQEELTAAFNAVFSDEAVPGDEVAGVDTGNVWIMGNAGAWMKITQASIGLANGSNPGMAKHSAALGKVGYYAAGVGEVNGWTDLSNAVSAATQNIASLQTAVNGKAPANASLTAETGGGTAITTPAVSSATVQSILQTIWSKIRQVANALSDYLSLSGGMMAAGSEINFAQSPIGTAVYAVRTMFGNTWVSLLFRKTGANAGDIGLMSSSPNSKIVAEIGTAPTRRAVLLDGQGNTEFPGNVDVGKLLSILSASTSKNITKLPYSNTDQSQALASYENMNFLEYVFRLLRSNSPSDKITNDLNDTIYNTNYFFGGIDILNSSLILNGPGGFPASGETDYWLLNIPWSLSTDGWQCQVIVAAMSGRAWMRCRAGNGWKPWHPILTDVTGVERSEAANLLKGTYLNGVLSLSSFEST